MPSVLYKQEKSLKLLPYSHFHPNNYSIACNAGPVSNIWFCITFLAGYTAIVRVYTVTWVIPLGVVDNIKTTLTWLCPSQYSKEHPFSCTELEATQQAAKELVICTLSKSVCSKQNFYHSHNHKIGFSHQKIWATSPVNLSHNNTAFEKRDCMYLFLCCKLHVSNMSHKVELVSTFCNMLL